MTLKISDDIRPLYGVYLIFLIYSIRFNNVTIYYLSEVSTIIFLSFVVYKLSGIRSFLRSYINFGALLLIIVLIYSLKADIYTFLVILKIYFLYKYFEKYRISTKQLVLFINVTYLLYFIYSLIIYIYISLYVGIESVNAFEINLFGFEFYTLFGIEGSTAYIDSYSGLVFIVNILLNNDSSAKKFFGGVSLIALMWTTRMTPLVATIGSFIYYYFMPIGLYYVLISFVVIQFGLAIWLKSQPDPIKFFFAAITHNRSLMWTQHFDIFWDSLNLKEIFLTTYGDEYKVQVYGHSRDTFNPHNSYFLLLFNSVIGFLILFYLFLRKSLSVRDDRLKAIIFFILVAAITNSKVIGLGNPIYLVIITYAISYSEKINNRNKYVLLKNVNGKF